MSAATIERERIGAELDRRRMLRNVGAILADQTSERQIERDSLADLLTDKRIMAAAPAERKRIREIAAARRRDVYTAALDYPMTPAELADACTAAALASKVGPDALADVVQDLVVHVIRRHGPNPPRVKLGAAWLRQRAAMIAIDQDRALERSTGARAAAAELSQWKDADTRAAAAAAAGNDPVWHLAAGVAAPKAEDALDAAAMGKRLGLSGPQQDALVVAIETDAPMTNSQRQAWHRARKVLRAEYPTVQALQIGYRPITYAAELLADGAISHERKRAEVGARGNGRPLTRWHGGTGRSTIPVAVRIRIRP